MAALSEFTMPSLGADMDAGIVLEWLVKPGDAVHRGDIVAVVDTAKAAVDVECFTSGTVQEILVDPGRSVPVGTVLATIAVPGEAGPAAVPTALGGTTASAQARADGDGHLVCSPLVRRDAARLGVDLVTVHGTGVGGRIRREDVEHLAHPGQASGRVPEVPAAPAARRRVSPYARRLARELQVDLAGAAASAVDGAVHAAQVRAAAEAAATVTSAAPAPAAGAREIGAAQRQAAMRATIAGLMARSKREIPHYYLSTTVDMSAAMSWLRDRNRELTVADRLVPAALMLKATALAARRVPQLNGSWRDDRFVASPAVHLGVAISLRGGGLVAPAIHDADALSVHDLMAALKDLVARARTGRLRGSEMSDPTLTVTNLGEQGVESVFGVIYPPQVALVGFGKVLDRPWAVGGLLGVRPTVCLTLSADHRATDGFTGARFLDLIDHLMQRPEEL
ncbi:MAG TPA: dihydrolipoamide acetyltransferase family protein [Kineosporiaceae bacterium]|nr:dihydrolipoamide acetyltransferase family protein [Kineosporiaceae bacterium]